MYDIYRGMYFSQVVAIKKSRLFTSENGSVDVGIVSFDLRTIMTFSDQGIFVLECSQRGEELELGMRIGPK